MHSERLAEIAAVKVAKFLTASKRIGEKRVPPRSFFSRFGLFFFFSAAPQRGAQDTFQWIWVQQHDRPGRGRGEPIAGAFPKGRARNGTARPKKEEGEQHRQPRGTREKQSTLTLYIYIGASSEHAEWGRKEKKFKKKSKKMGFGSLSFGIVKKIAYLWRRNGRLTSPAYN